jgi:hypothetical protein
MTWKKRLGAVLAIVGGGVLLTACDPPAKKLYEAACAGTLTASSPGALTSPPFSETSGLVASRAYDDLWYAHNDSGDSARFYAIATSGALRATYNITNATHFDWEDIAFGPGSNGVREVFVGDIGDNLKSRPAVVVYRVDEPAPPANGTTTNVTADVLTFTYPDGRVDTETMFVHWGLNRLYFVERNINGGRARIYWAPADVAHGSTTVLTAAGSISLPGGLNGVITGGDMSSDGSLLVLRTYGAVRLYKAEGKAPERALKSPMCAGPVPAGEPQGEAIAIAKDNRSYLTVSEGANAPLHRFTGP